MFGLLELEIKMNGSEIEYIEEMPIVGFTDRDMAVKYLDTVVNQKLADGFFTKVIIKNETNARLSNGGSYTKLLRITQII